MPLTDLEDPLSVVHKGSSSFFEYAGPKDLRSDTESGSDAFDSQSLRFRHWVSTLCGNNEDLLNRRLSWDALRAGHIYLQSSAPAQPAWFTTVLRLDEFLRSTSPSSRRFETEWAFGHIIELIGTFILESAETLAGASSWLVLTPTAVFSAHKSFVSTLSWLLNETLYLEFDVYRQIYEHQIARSDFSASPRANECYTTFVFEMLNGGLLEMLEQYPVLARLLGTFITQQVSHLAEFLSRFQLDLSEILDFLAVSYHPGRISHLNLSASDRHNDGRTVIILTFESADRVVYKPKPLQIDQAVAAFIQKIPACKDLGIRVPRALTRDNYGWAEFVHSRPCMTAEDVGKFYERIGSLLCIIYILGGTDFHSENLIADGAQPLLVDLETFMSPGLKRANEASFLAAHKRANELIEHSVLSSGLLPHWEVGADGFAFDVTGLGGHPGQQTSTWIGTWVDKNTDSMYPSKQRLVWAERSNRPYLGGVAVPAEDYVDAIAHGFELTYNSVVSERKTSSPQVMLNGLERSRVRFIHRPTKLYWQFLTSANHPHFLRDAAERRLRFDLLTKVFLSETLRPAMWPLVQHEISSLEVLDIPYFYHYADKVSLNLRDTTIPDVFATTGFESVARRLSLMSSQDKKEQVNLIRGAFVAHGAERQPLRYQRSTRVEKDSGASSEKSFLAVSIELATDIWENGIHAGGGVTWICPQYNRPSGRYQLQPMGPSLYDGKSGIGLYYAALFATTNEPRFKQMSLSCLDWLFHRSAEDTVSGLIDSGGLGVGTGLGSILYGAVRIGNLLRDPRPIEAALALALRFTESALDREAHSDLCIGVAGGVVGLLTLYGETREAQLLSFAHRIGERLLRDRCELTSHRSWRTVRDLPLAGMAHGAAGIALALYRLSSVSGDGCFAHAAEMAIDYENELYDPESRNWKDLRMSGDHGLHMNSWCHGAAGIGIARLAVLPLRRADTGTLDITRAIDAVLSSPVDGTDHLCCGNSGRIETLLLAGHRLDRPQLVAEAENRLRTLMRYKDEVGFNFSDRPIKTTQSPALFRGSSGIGYQMIRAQHPNLIPAILSFE